MSTLHDPTEGIKVHQYDNSERCKWCGLGVLQIFTDREDLWNAIECLKSRMRYGDLAGYKDGD